MKPPSFIGPLVAAERSDVQHVSPTCINHVVEVQYLNLLLPTPHEIRSDFLRDESTGFILFFGRKFLVLSPIRDSDPFFLLVLSSLASAVLPAHTRLGGHDDV